MIDHQPDAPQQREAVHTFVHRWDYDLCAICGIAHGPDTLPREPDEAVVERITDAILDAMETDNRTKGLFVVESFPRERYRDGLRLYARAALAAMSSDTGHHQREAEGLQKREFWAACLVAELATIPCGDDGPSIQAWSDKQREIAGKALTAAEQRAWDAAVEASAQVALQYRDEVAAGLHPDISDPFHSVGQAYAANFIAKRIRALAANQPAPSTGSEG